MQAVPAVLKLAAKPVLAMSCDEVRKTEPVLAIAVLLAAAWVANQGSKCAAQNRMLRGAEPVAAIAALSKSDGEGGFKHAMQTRRQCW